VSRSLLAIIIADALIIFCIARFVPNDAYLIASFVVGLCVLVAVIVSPRHDIGRSLMAIPTKSAIRILVVALWPAFLFWRSAGIAMALVWYFMTLHFFVAFQLAVTRKAISQAVSEERV